MEQQGTVSHGEWRPFLRQKATSRDPEGSGLQKHVSGESQGGVSQLPSLNITGQRLIYQERGRTGTAAAGAGAGSQAQALHSHLSVESEGRHTRIQSEQGADP